MLSWSWRVSCFVLGCSGAYSKCVWGSAAGAAASAQGALRSAPVECQKRDFARLLVGGVGQGGHLCLQASPGTGRRRQEQTRVVLLVDLLWGMRRLKLGDHLGVGITCQISAAPGEILVSGWECALCFSSVLVCHHPPFLIGNELDGSSPSEVCFAHSGSW